jgi:hypothetical protein
MLYGKQPEREWSFVMIDAYIDAFRKAGLSALTELDDDDQAAIANWAQDVVNRYGAILVENPMKLNDAKDLPHTKETIKIAIKTLMPAYVLKGMEDSVKLLKDRYVRLSTFQEIDSEDKKTIVRMVNDEHQTSARSDTSLMPTQQKYMQLALSEEKILLEDINAFLADLD